MYNGECAEEHFINDLLYYMLRVCNCLSINILTDDLSLQIVITKWVCQVPYACGAVYIGQMGWTMVTRRQGHELHVCLEQPEKSVLAENCILQRHQARFEDTAR